MEILVSSSPTELIWICNGGRTPRPWHIIAAFFFALIFLIARFFLDRLIFRRLAVRLLCNGCVPLKLNKARRAKVAKCTESMWKFSYYCAVQFCILAFVFNEPWFQHTYEFFNGWPDQELTLPVQLYYMCQCGFYLYSIAALLAWETRRKDFAVMMSHHVITVILLGVSYLTRFFYIGTVTLILHDTSDIYMEAAKVFKYSEKEFAASVLFGFFTVSWLFLRLICFPLCIIKATSYDIFQVLNLEDAYHIFLYYLFNTMLIMLLLFHIYWWVLIYAMIRRQLKNRGQVGEDIRSDSEDEN